MAKYFEQGVIDAFNNKSILERNIKSTRGISDYQDGFNFGHHLLDQININKFCTCDFDYSNLYMKDFKEVDWKEI